MANKLTRGEWNPLFRGIQGGQTTGMLKSVGHSLSKLQRLFIYPYKASRKWEAGAKTSGASCNFVVSNSSNSKSKSNIVLHL